MPNVLFAAGADRWSQYRAPLERAFDAAGLTVDLRTDFAAEDVDSLQVRLTAAERA